MRARSILAYNAGEGINRHDSTHKTDTGRAVTLCVPL